MNPAGTYLTPRPIVYVPIDVPPPPALKPFSSVVRLPNDNKIDWDKKFTDLKPKWYQSYKTTRLIGKILLGASLVSGAATLGTALFFKAKPWVVIYTVSGLATLTIALLAVSLFCRKKTCWNDPQYRREQGIKAENIIKTNEISFSSIHRQYHLFRKYNIFTNDDFNALFRDRVFDEKNPYDYLKNQLQILDESQVSRFGFAFDEANQEMLKRKLIESCKDNFGEVSEEEKRALDVSDDYLSNINRVYFLNSLIEKKITYFEFIEKMFFSLDEFPQESIHIIRNHAIEFLVSQNLGISNTLRRHDVLALNISMADLFNAGALKADLELLAINNNYSEFRAKHSIQVFAYMTDLEIPKKAYLSSYKIMREFKSDAKFFGDDIEKELSERFDSEMALVQSLQDIENRLGLTIFYDTLLTKNDIFVQKLVIKELRKTLYSIPKDSLLITQNLMSETIEAVVAAAKTQELQINLNYNQQKSDIDNEHKSSKAALEKYIHERRVKEIAPKEKHLSALEEEILLQKNQLHELKSTISSLQSDIEKKKKIHLDMQTNHLRIKEIQKQEASQGSLLSIDPFVAKLSFLSQLRTEKQQVEAKIEKFNQSSEQIRILKEKIASKENELKAYEKIINVHTQTTGLWNSVAEIRLIKTHHKEKDALHLEIQELNKLLAQATKDGKQNIQELRNELQLIMSRGYSESSFQQAQKELEEAKAKIKLTETRMLMERTQQNLSITLRSMLADNVLEDRIIQKEKESSRLEGSLNSLIKEHAYHEQASNVLYQEIEKEHSDRLNSIGEAYQNKMRQNTEMKQKALRKLSIDFLSDLEEIERSLQ